MNTDLRKLGRKEMLEILIEQGEELEQLKERLATAEAALADKSIAITESGSIAEAALRLNGVFEAAENACQQYIENITRQSRPQ